MPNTDRKPPTDTEMELLSFLALVVANMSPHLSAGACDRLRMLRQKMLREAEHARDEMLR